MIQVGDVVTLDNDKKYIVTHKVQLHKVNYVLLISETKPIEIIVALEKNFDGKIMLEELKNDNELDYVLSIFSNEKEIDLI